MPKYKDKMRLIQYGDVDDFTRYLILAGCSDDVVQTGLQCFVEGWERSVREIGQINDVETWDYDVHFRDDLHTILQYASPHEIAKFQDRINIADEKFRLFTEEHVANNGQEQHERWWWNRTRKKFP
jgi:hypothetical protein